MNKEVCYNGLWMRWKLRSLQMQGRTGCGRRGWRRRVKTRSKQHATWSQILEERLTHHRCCKGSQRLAKTHSPSVVVLIFFVEKRQWYNLRWFVTTCRIRESGNGWIDEICVISVYLWIKAFVSYGLASMSADYWFFGVCLAEVKKITRFHEINTRRWQPFSWKSV